MTQVIERLIWGFIYWFLNFCIILVLPFTGLAVLQYFENRINTILFSTLSLILIVPIITLLFYVSYLSKLCADYKVFSDMSFLNARTAAIGTINLKLSYLPIIGKIFKQKK